MPAAIKLSGTKLKRFKRQVPMNRHAILAEKESHEKMNSLRMAQLSATEKKATARAGSLS
jgi:hypothetical protein